MDPWEEVDISSSLTLVDGKISKIQFTYFLCSFELDIVLSARLDPVFFPRRELVDLLPVFPMNYVTQCFKDRTEPAGRTGPTGNRKENGLV
jgi:hypothetical protein